MVTFVLLGCPNGAETVASISRPGRITRVAIRHRNFRALIRDQKLFPHFGKAGAAVFAVEEVEYGGADPNPPVFSPPLKAPPSFFSLSQKDLNLTPPLPYLPFF